MYTTTIQISTKKTNKGILLTFVELHYIGYSNNNKQSDY